MCMTKTACLPSAAIWAWYRWKKFEHIDNVPENAIHHLGQPDELTLKHLITQHAAYTGSERAETILQHWDEYRSKFVKVMPNEYKRALIELSEQKVLEAA